MASQVPSSSKIRFWTIIGIVDSYDSVHSEIIKNYGDAVHADFWPGNHHSRWRWTFGEGLHSLLRECRPTKEHTELIKSHLTRKYGIEWMENGYHDWEKISRDYNRDRGC